MSTGTTPTDVAIQWSSEGEVTAADRERATAKIAHVMDALEHEPLRCDIRVTRSADPARERPVTARVTLDLDGRPVRARIVAREVPEAIDLLADRLRHRLETISEHRQALRRRPASTPAGEWRHGDAPTRRPDHHPRPREEREVVRRKSFAASPATLDEAVFDLEAVDHDFYLFVATDGVDSLVSHGAEGAYRLRRVDGSPRPDEPTVAAVVEDDTPTLETTVADACEHLDLADEPWVFFRNRSTGRANVAYLRYDGHYGLIAPAV